jgi:hypothetical protein
MIAPHSDASDARNADIRLSTIPPRWLLGLRADRREDADSKGAPRRLGIASINDLS